MATINGAATDDTIAGTVAGDLINGFDGDDVLAGRDGADIINGNNDNDILQGENGNDTLRGGSGTDTLIGGADDDRLIGGTGNDTLTGGTGADVFVIEAGSSDVVTDYNAGDGDSLDLTGPGVTLSSTVISEVAGDTVIDIGGGETVTLTGVTNAEFNSEPTVSGLTNRGAAEDTTGALNFSGVTIADADTPGNITVTITATDTGAVLGAVDGAGVGAGVVETASGNNVVTLVGTAADITTYLGNASAITYTSSQNRETDDTISIQADDGISTPNAASTATIVMTPINDLPTASDGTASVEEIDSYVFSASDFSFADVDSADTLVTVRIDTLTLTSGTFKLSGADVAATDVIAIGDINAGNLVFTPDASGDDQLVFDFSVNDGTGFATATSAFDIDVTSSTPQNLAGEGGSDSLVGAGGNDTVNGGDGDDTVNGLRGDDQLFGGDGNDDISGNPGSDTLFGGSGNDMLDSGDDDDNVWGGTGNDTMRAGAGADKIGGGSDGDLIYGGAGSDTIFAGTGDDTIAGDQGADLIFGGGGDDLVRGNLGDDTIWAGAGDDTLIGGPGDDVFVFGAVSGNDTITDFDTGDDTLDFSFSSLDDLAAVTAAASETTQGGTSGLLIDLGSGDSVFIEGLTVADLSSMTIEF